MHRNTILVTAFLAVTAALVVGVNLGKSMSTEDTVQTFPSATPEPTRQVTYKNGETCGVTYTYPDLLVPVESTTGATILAHEANPDESVVILCQEEIPHVPLTPDRIVEVMVPTASGSAVAAELFHDASQNDGTPIDKLIFTHPDTGLDVYVAGFGEVYDAVLRSLRLR